MTAHTRAELRSGGPTTIRNAPRPREPFIVVIILAITFLAYARTISFDFVYDDHGQIVQNPYVQSWKFVPQYFATHVWESVFPHAPGNYYRPFSLVWFLLNYSLFGLRPAGWHLTTVLLHLATTGLSYAVARKLTSNALVAAVTALLFGLHPIHVEVAAWVSASTESLYSALLLGTFLAYLASLDKSPLKWKGGSAALYAAALFSKETAIVFPILVYAHAWIYEAASQRSRDGNWKSRHWKAFLTAAPYLPVAILYLALRMLALKGLGHATANLTFSTIALTWPSALWFYLKLLLFPVGVSEFYDLPYVARFSFAQVLLPALVCVIVAWLTWRWRQLLGARHVAMAAAWMFVPLLPLLNLSFLSPGDIVHDRYLYLPSFGFLLLVALVLQTLARGQTHLHGYPTRVVLPAVIISFLLVVGSVYQSQHWKNNFALYSYGVQTAPRNATVKNNLANELIQQGRYQEAKVLYEQVLSERPDFWLSNYNLGYLYYRMGNLAEAERFLLRAIQIDSADADQYAYLGLARLRMGRLAEAAADLRRAIALQPQSPGYHFALGVVWEQSGDCKAARAEFAAELAINPGNTAAQQKLQNCADGGS